MSLRIVKVILFCLALSVTLSRPAAAQLFTPGNQGSANMKVMSHVPLGGPFKANSIDIEQELSRPYVYVSRRKDAGFHAISIKDPSKAQILYSWQIENQPLHMGRALGAVFDSLAEAESSGPGLRLRAFVAASRRDAWRRGTQALAAAVAALLQ